ncbi:ABC transporter substrate-binding protein [Paenibacillus sp. Root444D2]|uniref:ABC transporter substrate-binding protein n=1 Tax=Paenibacillus sp. Root444D2 TaxID=1736538 RepID=UPI00070C7238|nr:sugar ABC transporter substrate-binding protein [Paenibacillus sp. Root444D2]KQX46926.1 ABC transporter substrate-binding protein [Paenibacillus sp. Root444D2]
MKAVKMVSLAGALTLALGTAAGCSNSTVSSGGTTTSAPTSGNDSKAATTEVTLMTWESQAMNDKIMASMKKFEEKNPGITVKLLPAPLQDYGIKINEMMAAKQAPDIFMTGNDMTLQNGTKGLLYDWSAKASSDKDFMNGFYPGVVDSWKSNNKLYGLPGLLNTYGVFYNKKLFKDAGLPDPKQGWTYDEFFGDMAKLTSNKGGVQQYGYYGRPDAFNMSLYSVSAGGAPFTDSIVNPTKVEVSPQFIEGVKKYQKAIADKSMIPPTFDQSGVMASFKDGKVAMTMQGQWVADDLIRNAPNLEWGYAPQPVVKTQSEIYDAVGWCSPATIKNPDAVWKVLMYLDSSMYQEVLPSTPVAPAAYKSAAGAYFDTLKKAGHPDLADGIDYILKSPNIQPVRFLTTWSGKAGPFIDAVWNNVLSGKAGEAELKDTVDKVNKVIASSK